MLWKRENRVIENDQFSMLLKSQINIVCADYVHFLCLDELTLGPVGEFGRSGDAGLHSQDIRGVHGVPQIQTGRKRNSYKADLMDSCCSEFISQPVNKYINILLL